MSTAAVLEAVRRSAGDALPALLRPLTPAERRTLVPELTALRREVRGWDWSRWQERERIRRGLLLAGAACHTGAAAAAAWIAARDLRTDNPARRTALLLHVLADRDPAWLGDVAHRLAARAATAEEDYPLIRELVRRADCPLPTGDAFVNGWVREMSTGGPGRSAGRGRPLRAALREEPQLRAFVPLLFETAEPAEPLSWYGRSTDGSGWPAELARLAADGLLDRSVLADGCTARLLRGGRPAHLSFYLDLLQALDLTQDEQQARTGDWIAMAGDAPSPLAGHAQGILAGLAEAGRLTAEQLAEMSAAVLFRPEKKLVRAQLVLLGKALRRSPDDRAVLLPAAAAAFGHADTALQERALRLAAAHLRPEDDALRAELADQAGLLGPVHRRAAAELLGASAGGAAAGPCEDVLPPAPERRRTAPAADLSLAATVELVAALTHARQPDPAEFETALDALVRHAHRDRAALAAVLHPALADRRWLQADGWTDPEWFEGVELVAATVLGCVRAVDLRTAGSRRGVGYPHDCVHAALGAVTTARIREAAARILTDPLPFLLATPTWDTGTLEPLELVARLAEYGRLGAAPAPADFAQALLRVRRDPEAAAAASALGTAEGGRLAAWLASAGEPPRTARRVQEPASAASRLGWDRTRETVPRIVVELPERPALQDGSFPAEFRRLGRPYADTGRRCYHWSGYELAQHSVMPEDRETQAVWLLPALTACATVGERGAGELLARIAELGGPAGAVLHLAVATGLGARHAEDRLAAVDALLVLAARGELDAALLGRDLAELLALGTVKPNRLADAARTAAATGAYRLTWTLLAQALPALLAGGAGARGAGEVLAVAADCAEGCGAAGPAPEGLAGAAERAGSSQLAVQARRLRTALAEADARAGGAGGAARPGAGAEAAARAA
ncbi:hypothetical protein SUDANB120_00685 [Streptomyces sp. enrichment culture]|uniref:DUF7824 domain-containing protein n=1 Tax=Streptomyces sp. enrichment culture TaxID=1795815 RepID=UPI003F557BD5